VRLANLVSASFIIALILGAPAWANLVITPTYDSTIKNDANAVAIESTIQSGINAFEADFKNPITVQIYFQEGGGLGQSNFFVYDPSYLSFHTGLVANNANPAAIAALNANGGSGTNNPVTNDATIEMKSANMRALGISQVPNCVPNPTGLGTSGGNVPNTCTNGTVGAYDGIISLNTPITDPPGPNDGSHFGLLSVTEHEIDEVLGLGSALENHSAASGVWNTTPFADGDPAPEDLFRWNAATGGSRTLGTNCATPTSAFFSYGPSTGEINQFNNTCNGDDFGDWSNAGFTQSEAGTAGTNPTLGASEISALTAIGYTFVPEPSTIALMFLGCLAIFAAARRKRA